MNKTMDNNFLLNISEYAKEYREFFTKLLKTQMRKF